MAKGNIQGRITIKGASQAQAKFKKTRKSAQEMTTAGGDIVKIAAAAGAVGLSLGVMTAAAERAATALHRLAREGGEFSSIATTFERIGSPELLRRMQSVTGGLVDMSRLMAETNQVLQAHIIEEDLWARALGGVARAAQATGERVPEMIQALSVAAAGGGIEAFQRLGVDIFAVRGELQELGLSMESTRGREVTLTRVTEELERQYGSGALAVGNYDEAVTNLEVQFRDYRVEVGRAIAEDEALVESLVAVRDILVGTAPDAENLGEAIAGMTVSAAESVLEFQAMLAPILAVASAIGEVASAVRRLQEFGNIPAHLWNLGAMAPGAARWGEVGRGGGAAPGGRTSLLDPYVEPSLLEGIRSRRGSRQLWEGESSRLGPDPWAIPGDPQSVTETTVAARRRGGGGGGAGGPSGIGMETMLREMGELATLGQAIAEYEERAAEAAGALKAHLDGVAIQQERIADAAEATLKAQLDGMEARQELEEQYIASLQLEAQISREAAEKARDNAMATAEAAGGAFAMLGGIMQQIIAQQEAAGESAEATKIVYGSFLIAYNAVMAATQVAEAIGSIPVWPLVISHSASAASHVAAAVMAAVQLGGGSAAAASSAGAAAPTSTFAPAKQMQEPFDPTREGVTISNQYLLSDSEAGLARVMERAQWRRTRQHRVIHSRAVRYGA